jgi:hypothetical protein
MPGAAVGLYVYLGRNTARLVALGVSHVKLRYLPESMRQSVVSSEYGRLLLLPLDKWVYGCLSQVLAVTLSGLCLETLRSG